MNAGSHYNDYHHGYWHTFFPPCCNCIYELHLSLKEKKRDTMINISHSHGNSWIINFHHIVSERRDIDDVNKGNHVREKKTSLVIRSNKIFSRRPVSVQIFNDVNSNRTVLLTKCDIPTINFWYYSYVYFWLLTSWTQRNFVWRLWEFRQHLVKLVIVRRRRIVKRNFAAKQSH